MYGWMQFMISIPISGCQLYTSRLLVHPLYSVKNRFACISWLCPDTGGDEEVHVNYMQREQPQLSPSIVAPRCEYALDQKYRLSQLKEKVLSAESISTYPPSIVVLRSLSLCLHTTFSVSPSGVCEKAPEQEHQLSQSERCSALLDFSFHLVIPLPLVNFASSVCVQ
jgi:hypothetical protein